MLSALRFSVFISTVSALQIAPQMVPSKARSATKLMWSPSGFLEGQATIISFDCGVCGGMSDNCPACRGPAPAALKASLQAINSLECGVCGGMPDSCPACRGPAPAAFETSSMPTIVDYECGVCGGMSDNCPVCRGPAPGAFEGFGI